MDVNYTRWGSEVKCTIGGGWSFRIYWFYEKPIGLFWLSSDMMNILVTRTVLAKLCRTEQLQSCSRRNLGEILIWCHKKCNKLLNTGVTWLPHITIVERKDETIKDYLKWAWYTICMVQRLQKELLKQVETFGSVGFCELTIIIL